MIVVSPAAENAFSSVTVVDAFPPTKAQFVTMQTSTEKISPRRKFEASTTPLGGGSIHLESNRLSERYRGIVYSIQRAASLTRQSF
jgi:hypothetical protein